MAFLFKAGNHVTKYHRDPRRQKHSAAKAAFELRGKISRSEGQIG